MRILLQVGPQFFHVTYEYAHICALQKRLANATAGSDDHKFM